MNKLRGLDDWKHTGEKPDSLDTIVKRLEDEIEALKEKVIELEETASKLYFVFLNNQARF